MSLLSTKNVENCKNIIVVGSGFGGYAAVQQMRGKSHLQITVIDKTNHHLFQPLLYQVATAILDTSDIAVATRSIFGQYSNVHVLMDEVQDIDTQARQVKTQSGLTLDYDDLILATGSTYNFYGNDQWRRHVMVLKTLDDALAIRCCLLQTFEKLERSQKSDLSVSNLTFVVIGAGPTGVELAGAISELTRHSLLKDFKKN